MAYFEIKYVDYETDLKVVKMAVKEEITGPGQLLGYRLMHQTLQSTTSWQFHEAWGRM